MKLEHFIILAGLCHFAILTASALVPKVLDWRRALAPLPEFLRRLFWVYGIFIVMVIIGFGLLSLFFAQTLASGIPLARGVCAFIAVFWAARLGVQFFVFDPSPWLTTRWLKAGYHSLTVAFVFLAAVYSIAALKH